MKPEYVKAVSQLTSLRVGDVVKFSDRSSGGESYQMTVSRELHRSDGCFGSFESSRVTVTFGPGRYSRELTADQIAHGEIVIENNNS